MKNIILIMVIITLIMVIPVFATTPNVVRSLSQISNGKQVVTYTVEAPGKWGVTIEDNVVGECTFPGGKKYQALILSTQGNSKSVTVNVAGQCSYEGNYQFANGPIVNFNGETINSTTPATSSSNFMIYIIIGGIIVLVAILYFVFK